MKMDEENRKKLETFWRRKLWLGLAAVGALGLAAWRVSAVQSRYDDVLVQESRELPEKVYQELMAEIKTDLPIVDASRMHVTHEDENSQRLRYCSAIYTLGELGNPNLLLKLQTMLKNTTNSISLCGSSFGNSSVADMAIISLGKIDDKQSLNLLQTAFYQLPSLETIAELRRMLVLNDGTSTFRTDYPGMTVDAYEKQSKIIQNLSSLGQLQVDFRNLELLRTWMKGNLLDLDRTGKMYAVDAGLSPVTQNPKLSQTEIKIINEDRLSANSVKYFYDRQYRIIEAAANLNLPDKSIVVKMLVKMMKPKPPITLKEATSKEEIQSQKIQFARSIFTRLMVNRQNNEEIITLFQKSPLDKYLPTKSLYPPNKNKQYRSCIRLPKILNEMDQTVMPATYEGEMPGSMYDPTCEQNLDSSELFQNVLTHLKSPSYSTKYRASLALSALDAKIYGRQMISPIIDIFQQLHKNKSLSIHFDSNSYSPSPSSYGLVTRKRLLDILQNLANRGLLTPTDRKKLLPVLMLAYRNIEIKPYQVGNGRLEHIEILRLIRKLNESEKVDRTAQLRTQQLFYLETGVLGTIGLTSLILLLLNLRLRNPFSLFWSTYLIFPEEVVAELIALKQRRQSEKVTQWKIRLELAYEIITLIWAFHILIRIDDLKLPPGGNRSAK